MIEKVVEMRYSQPSNLRETSICYHVRYARTKRTPGRVRIFGCDEIIPMTVVKFMDSDDVECKTEYCERFPGSELTTKVTTYTRKEN